MDLRKAVAIVGAAESDQIGIVPTRTALELHVEAASNALADAGLTTADVDGLFTTGTGWAPSMLVAEYLGLKNVRYTDATSTGGSAFVIMVEHALAAVHAGLCEVALVTHGESGYSNRKRPIPNSYAIDPTLPEGQYEAPFGVGSMPSIYAMAAARHMYQYGTTSEQLAQIAVSTREWAALNPRAFARDPLTIADVLASPMIAYPLHRLDCCLVTDAGGAIVITSASRARDCRKRPVWVLGSGEAHTHNSILSMPDLTWTAARQSGAHALGMAGLQPNDIDVLEIYDSFTYTVLVTLESLGFCEPGEGGALVADGRLGPGGSLPTNTNGGGLSYTHPGMYGMFTLVEATRQLRGECGERQVPNARTALCNGTGGVLSSTGTVVLGAD